MASPFLGQLKIVAFNFAPRGYALCNGQVLPIAQNTALFSLLGTTYGGNGTTNFALPNLQARVPVHFGTALNGDSVVLGQPGGEDSHTLSLAEMPAHNHELQGLAIAATSGGPGSDAKLADAATNPYRASSGASVSTKSGTVSGNGGSQPHENRQPFLAVNFIIALQGIFPSRN